MAVEDGQEGEPEDRCRHQPHPPSEQPLTGEVGQPHRDRAEDRGDHAGDDVYLRGVACVGAHDGVATPEPQLEHDVQDVAVGGRVEEVVGVEGVAEEGDRLGDEVRFLVDVVDVGQPLLDPP